MYLHRLEKASTIYQPIDCDTYKESMRVLEKEVVSPYSMGKKNKHKLRKSKENENSDSSEEVSGRGCVHVSKAVNFNSMKKGFAKQTLGECQNCAKEASKKGEPKTLIDHIEGATSGEVIDEHDPTIWVCLQCGNQGCGRNSPEKHALKHYETPRSSQHNVVVNTATWSAWCYDCDDELLPEKYKKVAECMEHLKKAFAVPTPDSSMVRNSNGGSTSSMDLIFNKSRPLSGKGAVGGCNKVKGLSNLGNTCFFNAVMQNLVQTQNLENLIGERRKGPMKLQCELYADVESCSSSDEGDYPTKEMPAIEINISEPGALTNALMTFLQDINSPSRSGCINPSTLFSQVCKKAPRFKGMQQQDSHELLRYLLDNMKTEEIKRGQSGILKYFKLSETTNPKKVDEETKMKVKAYGRQIKHTFVECLFGGQLISTVVCEECKYISQILEPFLDLSLPVTEEKRKGVKNKGDVVDDDNKEDDDNDDKDDGDEKTENDGKTEDQEEKYDASDADVEDNLESDTSKCYGKTLSDSVVTSHDETITESPEKSTMSHEMDISAYRLDTSCDAATFNIETTIDNCSPSLNSSVMKTSSVNDVLNGNDGSKTDDKDISVSYTLTNGCLTQNEGQLMNGELNGGANYSFSCASNNDKNICNGDIEINGSEDFNQLKNGVKNSIHEVKPELNGNVNSSIKSDEIKSDKSVVDLTSSVSTLSIGDNSSSVTSNLSQLTLKDENDTEDGENETESRKERDNDCNKQGTASSDCVNGGGDLLILNGDIHGTYNVQCKTVTSPTSRMFKFKEFKKEGQRKSINTLADRYHPTSGECSVESCLNQFTAAELLTGNNKFGCKNCTKLKYKNQNKDKKDKRETVYSNANKQYLVFQPPAVLTLHLKRFEQVGFSSRKVNRHVEFPFTLDIAPYCSSMTQGIKPGQKKILYSLFGVVEHSGRLTSGHYTAYVKVRPNIGTITNFLNKHNVTLREYLNTYAQQVMNGQHVDMDMSDDINENDLEPPGRWYHISDSRVNEVTVATVERAQAYILFYERMY
ncbi:Ubiquitin carboxyl-terminal hydrolase 16 [Mactra antiquata]